MSSPTHDFDDELSFNELTFGDDSDPEQSSPRPNNTSPAETAEHDDGYESLPQSRTVRTPSLPRVSLWYPLCPPCAISLASMYGSSLVLSSLLSFFAALCRSVVLFLFPSHVRAGDSFFSRLSCFSHTTRCLVGPVQVRRRGVSICGGLASSPYMSESVSALPHSLDSRLSPRGGVSSSPRVRSRPRARSRGTTERAPISRPVRLSLQPSCSAPPPRCTSSFIM